MKKLLTVLLSLAVLLLSTACQNTFGNNTFVRDGYSKSDVSLYDTKSQEHLCLGDSKSNVERILGNPDEKPSRPTAKGLKDGKTYIYNEKGVDVDFDDNDTVKRLTLSKSIYSNDDSVRLAEMLPRNLTIDDFMTCFPDAYESDGLEMYKRKRIVFKEQNDVLFVDEQGDYIIYADYDDKKNNDIIRMVITYNK